MTRDELRQKRIGVLMGGISAEREISLQTGSAVLDALAQQGYRIVAIDVDADICQRLAEAQIEVAFVALHGRFGEDGCIQGLLELLGIPYTGSGVLASALAMDKVLTKRLLFGAGLPTPPWDYPAALDSAAALGLPLVLKPRAEGSSVGITIARTEAELSELLDRVGPSNGLIAERYVGGRELTLAVLGQGEKSRALGTLEIRAAEGFYDYQAKYQRDDTQYLVPAPLPAELTARLEQVALATHRLLDCRGATRVDFRWDEQLEPMVLEINTLPGLTGHSLLPKIAAHGGIDYGELVERILEDASLKA
jgi:D-alanine-D-alanine ligase